MINELKELLENSNEDEVKSLLFQILLRINRMEETNFPKEQFTKDLKKIYKDFLNYKSKQITNGNEKDYKVVHIVFGDSSSGSLKMKSHPLILLGLFFNAISFTRKYLVIRTP
ncbi:hypothetical protein [Metabacillus fastidiosus]|uniref:hypothetical protein n=1 Tax=Metabacillus fastidiosus TaxID=1458 RepID=UPI002DBC25A8|nr:hypothetical protein [Metabacillus fastidiosus]MEC2075360.1 hypothetical protein [Metabacillus fastidiosus]